MKSIRNRFIFKPEEMFVLPERKGDDMLLVPDMLDRLKQETPEDFSRSEFLHSCEQLAILAKIKDCMNLEGTEDYIDHITNAFISMKSDDSRQSIFKDLNQAYGEELFVYGKPAQKMYESIFSFCIENKVWEYVEKGPWSWSLFGLIAFILKPTLAFNVLEKYWKYDNGMKSSVQELIKIRDKFSAALKYYDKYKPDNSGGRNHLVAITSMKRTAMSDNLVIVSNKNFSTDTTLNILDNMIYLGQHPEENCATNFNEVLMYMDLMQTFMIEGTAAQDHDLIKIENHSCIDFMSQALHYYTACYAIRKASDKMDEKYKDFYPEGKDAVAHLILKTINAITDLTKKHNSDVMRRKEEAEKRAAEERKKKEEEMQKQQEKVKARHVAFEKEGFKLFSENNSCEKWVKDNGKQSIDRFFIKASTPNDRLRLFQNMEELGLSSGKLRNVKSSAGVLRYLKLGEEEIGTDTLVEEAYAKIRKIKPPVTKRETIDITDTLFTLACDKLFFSLEDLEKAADRIKPTGVTLADIRGLIKMMRDRGIIGQVKTKKKGAKVFALTAEGMAIARNKADTKLPLIHVSWSDTIGEIVNDYVGKSDILDVVTLPVKNIDAMIEGKAPKFLDKYYVTEI